MSRIADIIACLEDANRRLAGIGPLEALTAHLAKERGIEGHKSAELTEAREEAKSRRDRALADLIGAEAKTQGEALRKAAALVGPEMSDEAAASVRADAKRLTDTSRDPVVMDATRLRDLQAVSLRLSDDPFNGNGDSPENLDLDQQQLRLYDRLKKQPPTSPEGVAALADIIWNDFGPGLIAGTPDWEDAITNNPEYALLRRLRHGARIVAEGR
ncbi:hypothetical protein [Wenxinia saemankumensis]|uniref:Uncharacterized protein n=1 Tax=Wenxinia saemankumensis TaxID=1447782 RepID=A0A1M6HQW1_9RHOB|nr:hypothetical protein [Wenxinia saemankumensis]SHJ24581.1 hypothetical protein SAMN05444417_3302 [Wenxinia saemankumensis]